MTLTSNSLWKFLDGPGTITYTAFDWLRDKVNYGLIRFFAAHGLKAGSKALEAGSGPGFGTALLASELHIRALALDFDSVALTEGRRRSPHLLAVCADLFKTPFPDGAFDLVWSSSTFEHLDDRDAALREMARLARSGGQIFIGVPNRRGPLFFQPWIATTAVGKWLGAVFDLAELRCILQRAGLRPTHTYFYFFRMFVGVLASKP